MRYVPVHKDLWTSIFKSLKKVCKETRLKELLIHRIMITRTELFIFSIKTDDKCLYCGDKDSNEHTFIECLLMRSFAKKSFNGLMKLIVVRTPLPLKNSCLVLFLAPKKQK